MPYTYGSCEGYFGGIIKVSRALCQCPTIYVYCFVLFRSHSCQCETLNGKVLASTVINTLYLHGEITATESQMKILRKEITRKIIFHCLYHSFFAKIIWQLYNIWLIIKAKPFIQSRCEDGYFRSKHENSVWCLDQSSPCHVLSQQLILVCFQSILRNARRQYEMESKLEDTLQYKSMSGQLIKWKNSPPNLREIIQNQVES